MKFSGHTMQSTLADRIEIAGVGVHSGAPVAMTLSPADPGTGVVFCRTDFDDRADAEIRAHHTLVSATDLCTIVGDIAGPSVSTVEHLLAALSAFGIDNVHIEIDSAETPILDGSAQPFVDAIRQVGVKRQNVARRYVRVRKPVRVEVGKSFAEIAPHDSFQIDVEIDFDTPLIGRQRIVVDLTQESFCSDLARARTFGFMKDVEKLWSMGFAMGSSLENSVAIGDDRILNPEGLRWSDEFVRHKTLDAVGDLALAGLPIIGHFRSLKGGHRLNWLTLKALFADAGAWEVVRAPAPARETMAAPLAPSPVFAPAKA